MNDELIFAEEDDAQSFTGKAPRWKVMIVDDEPEIHKVTCMVLEDFSFSGKGIEFISAYSAAEAKTKLEEHRDIAMILLDVVMEEEDAGLQLVRYIREDIKNRNVRIVLRTGQPGQAPEEKVILNYDINDYKSKTELTSTKLFTAVVASLRSYRDIKTLETNKRGLETILGASTSIFELQAMEKFAEGVLTQLTSLLHLEEDALYVKASGFAASNQGDSFRILSGTGIYSDCVDREIEEVAEPDVIECLELARSKKKEIYLDEQRYVGYFRNDNGNEHLLYLQGWEALSEWDRYLLEIFCANVALAYDNISLNSEILETQREIIFKLGEVVETRSRETGNHVKRVAEYAAVLARACGLSDEEVKTIHFASPMHDLGKMAIPDSVLNKAGKLTDEEFDLIKAHTQIGHDMLKNSNRELLRAAAIIAAQHHERYDGQGYPAGLKGEDIHIYGRITAIVDVFDALGVQRVYKDAWPLEKILEYFHEERGKHFDPKLTDIFLENLDDIIAIRDQFPDVE